MVQELVLKRTCSKNSYIKHSHSFFASTKPSPKFHPVAFWEAPFNRISSPSPSTTSIGRTISCSSWNLSVRRKSRMKFHHLPPGNPGKIPHSLVSRILKHQQHELAKVIIFIVFSFSCCVEWHYTPASDMKKKHSGPCPWHSIWRPKILNVT